MKENNKVKIGIAILGFIGTIAASIIGIKYGEEKQNNYVKSQIANVTGDGNIVTMNSVDDLIDNYNKIIEENEKLKKQNTQYFDDYITIKSEKEALSVQLQDSPTIELKNLGLCINGEDVNINKNNSYVIINGVEYFSKDFINNLVDENTSVVLKNDVMYLGKVIADKATLFSQRVVDSNRYEIVNNATDSYGNTHSDAAKFAQNSVVNYNLNGKYSLLRFKIAIDESSNGGYKSVISISADGKTIYTTDEIEKVATKEIECQDLKINNCTLLTIECTGDYNVYPLIYEAEVYN